jgi:hypothetical protein
MRHDCPVRPEDLGPYLLGQLGDEDAALVEQEVASCPSCTAEVERLRPVVAALAVGGAPDEQPAATAPVPALNRVLAAVRAEQAAQRRRLWARIGAVAASLLLVLGAVAGGVMWAGRSGGTERIALSGASPASGSATVAPREWGTAISLDLRGLTPGTSYGAWLADDAGKRVPAGTFRPLADGSARLDLGASLTLEQAARLGVTALGGDDVLVADLTADH